MRSNTLKDIAWHRSELKKLTQAVSSLQSEIRIGEALHCQDWDFECKRSGAYLIVKDFEKYISWHTSELLKLYRDI